MFKKLPALFLITISSFGVGFVNQLLISKSFGTSTNLDFYWLFLSLVNFLAFYVFPLRDSVAPIFYRELKCREEAIRLASASVSLCICIAVLELIILFGLIFAFPSQAFSGYFSASPESIKILLWLLPSILLVAVVEMTSGLLLSLNLTLEQAICRFIAPCVTTLLLTFFADIWGEVALAVSFTVANLLVTVASILFLFKSKIGIRFISPRVLIRPGIKNMFLVMAFVYIFAHLYVLFERYVFLQFGPGVISGFQYAFMLVTALIGVVSGPICNVLWPYFMAINHDDPNHRQEKLLDALWVYLGFPLVLLAIFVFNNAHSIVYFIFYRGEFGIQSVEISASALMFLIFALVPACLSQVVLRLLNAQNNFLGIGAIGISMSCIGISLLVISLLQHNLNLAMSQWLIANFVGGIICMIITYRYLGLRQFLNWGRINLLIKLGVLILLSTLISPHVLISSSKLILGLELAKSFLIYSVLLSLALVLLNHSYFPFTKVLIKKVFR
jgi:putative peptidoglycan lipid II flippase